LYIVERSNNDLSSWWVDSSFQEISVNNPHFDYEYYLVLVGSRSVVMSDVLESVELYKKVNRLAWLYQVTTEDLANATIDSTTNGIVDFELLRQNIKKIYSNKFDSPKFDVSIKKEEQSNNQLVNTLNSITPSQLVENKYSTKLTGSEIEIFDKLLTDTNISVGILNVLIIYVMDTKNGEIPSYNYFLKIINTWIRKGVKTTEDALNLITTPNTKGKPKNVPTWYQDYLQEIDNKKQKKNENKQETLDDLEEFFNTKKE
jgi:replication initiation and membrane attachment protein